MPKTSPSYRVVELPPSRRETHNYLDVYWWKHSIYALLEVDVTRARQAIAEHKAQTGEALSFTGYLACCLARAVAEDKSVQAYPKGRKHLVIFDDVDVFFPVERQVDGATAAIPYIIRGADQKSFLRHPSRDSRVPDRAAAASLRHALGVPADDVDALAAAPAVRQSPQPNPRCGCGGHGRRDGARHGRSRRGLGSRAGRAVPAADRGWHRP